MDNKNKFPYSFNSDMCETCGGRCCRGTEGHVWVSVMELETIAAAKNMMVEAFSKQYARRVKGKLSLKEHVINGEHRCCFLDLIENKCTIYEVRPGQCRTYPFWDEFKKDPQEVVSECPGVVLKN